MRRGPDRGYFPDPDKSIFILDTPGQEEAVKRDFSVEGLTLNFVSGFLIPRGISRSTGGVRGVGETPNGGMGPRGKRVS